MVWIVVVVILAVMVGFSIMVVWATKARVWPYRRVAGIPPWTEQLPLEDGEQVITQLSAIHSERPRWSVSGYLYFTNRRIAFLPDRRFGRRPHDVPRGDISDWRIERRHQIGFGAVEPLLGGRALIVETRSGQKYVYWAAVGYDIVSKATGSLPPELRREPRL